MNSVDDDINALQAELERLREEKDAGWQAYEYAKDRLHRIEEAARGVFDHMDEDQGSPAADARYDDLRAALEGDK